MRCKIAGADELPQIFFSLPLWPSACEMKTRRMYLSTAADQDDQNFATVSGRAVVAFEFSPFAEILLPP
jgi:hypothetical protein